MPLRTATRRKQNGHQTAKSRRNTYYMHLSPSGKSTFYMHYHLSGYKLIPLCRISPIKCSLLAKRVHSSHLHTLRKLSPMRPMFFTNSTYLACEDKSFSLSLLFYREKERNTRSATHFNAPASPKASTRTVTRKAKAAPLNKNLTQNSAKKRMRCSIKQHAKLIK